MEQNRSSMETKTGRDVIMKISHEIGGPKKQKVQNYQKWNTIEEIIIEIMINILKFKESH